MDWTMGGGRHAQEADTGPLAPMVGILSTRAAPYHNDVAAQWRTKLFHSCPFIPEIASDVYASPSPM